MNEKEQIAWLISAEEKREHISLCNLHDALFKMQAKATQLDSPHIQELIECDRIETKIFKLHFHVTIFVSLTSGLYDLQLENPFTGHQPIFNGKTKLEALRKAEEWLDGRGVEQ